MNKILLASGFLLFFISNFFADDFTLINTSHLDHLYEEIEMDGDQVGIIHIYSEHPDYNWVGDDDEGIACVDDAARAAIFYLMYYKHTGEQKHLDKTKKLIRFLLKMQSQNGFFFNFIWKDGSINRTFKTSVDEPNWWSWRALWALSEAADYFKNADSEFFEIIIAPLKKGIKVTRKWLPAEKTFKEYGGFSLPVWLPYETASDQAAVLIKTMTKFFEVSGDSSVIEPLTTLCEGIVMMQQGDSAVVPYNAFLSWQNTWHAWGNSQADALLYAGKILRQKKFIDAALNEARNFYPFLIHNYYYSDFIVEKDSVIEMKKISRFSQIAYGIRPIIFAAVSAFDLTGDTSFAETAAIAAGWFFGNNMVSKKMYDPGTGRGFDGIVSQDKINLNSGAESTIEALLSLLKVEQNKNVKGILDSILTKQQ